jgi:hypothetical protein
LSYREIADVQVKCGDLAEAKATVGLIKSENELEKACRSIVAAQAAAGDPAGAVEFCAGRIANRNSRCKCLVEAAKKLLGKS